MNKYQDALDFIEKNSCHQKKACNECDFNRICNSFAKEKLDVLQELVDKATPKKPHHFVHERYTRYYCPKCSKRLKKSWSAFPICTTMIDWSDE